MNIQEAVKATSFRTPYIRRKCWTYVTDLPTVAIKIQPTDTPDCCIIYSSADEKARHGWQPTASDLMADDWETIPPFNLTDFIKFER